VRSASLTPKVSVLMPSLNQCEFIEVAVRSVLEQNHPGTELVISDGGSSDGSLGLLERMLVEFGARLRWVSAADSGPANAVNRAMQSSSGEIIGWLNADDIYATDAIGVAARRFAADTDLVMIYGEAEHVDASGSLLYRYPTRPPSAGIEAFQTGCFICQPTVFLRRCVFDQLGGLDEGLSTAFDFDLWLRVFHYFPGRIGYTDRVQAYSRLHGSTITSLQRKAVASEATRLLSRYLGNADLRWILTYVDEAVRAYPTYDTKTNLQEHVLTMVAELASCFADQALSDLRSLLAEDRRLTALTAGVHADMFPDGWAGRELSIRIRSPLRGSYSLLLQCDNSRPIESPLSLNVKTSCGTEMDVDIERRGEFEISILLSNVEPAQLLFVSVHSSTTFVPMIAEHGSTDTRELAFRISQITLVALEGNAAHSPTPPLLI
jgi:glycosyltransferase involved in cell wall biosynthesis